MNIQSYLTIKDFEFSNSQIASQINSDCLGQANKYPPITIASPDYKIYQEIQKVIFWRFTKGEFPDSEKTRLWKCILLGKILPNLSLKLEPNHHYKKSGPSGTSYLTDFNGKLYAITKIYLKINHSHGTENKRLRLAICLTDNNLNIINTRFRNDDEENNIFQNGLLLQEALTLQSLLGTEHIFPINHLTNNEVGKVRFLQEFSTDGTLGKFMDVMEEGIDEVQKGYIFKFLDQILEGINELSARDFIHQDLKPENVILHRKNAYISDLGLTVRANNYREEILDELRSNIQVCFTGTREYQAPERHIALKFLNNSRFFEEFWDEDVDEKLKEHIQKLKSRFETNAIDYLCAPGPLTVWSFGCIVYEFAYDGTLSFYDENDPESFVLTFCENNQQEFEELAFSQVLDTPFEKKLADLAKFILILDPKDRPDVLAIKRKLDALKSE